MINESLRFMPSVATSSIQLLSEDAKLGNFQIKAGDAMMINYFYLHRNSKQW